MSTNYYLKLHLGKVNAGSNGTKIWTWDESVFQHSELLRALPYGEITDEYGSDLDAEEINEILKGATSIRYSHRDFS